MTFLIYGANGYTGELVAREAKRRGHSPVLAGRNADKIRALAAELGLPARVFALDDPAQIVKELAHVRVVLHCAGPFSATSAPMLTGCLRARRHYLDITGEISVFEHAQSQHTEAEAAGVVVCSGVGFDVVPTDCVAAALKEALPDATSLALGFFTRSGMSAGTAKSSIEGMLLGGRVRKNGLLEAVPLAHRVRRIDFGDGGGERLAATIPWGDVSTAYYTTGIPNIEVYAAASRAQIRAVRALGAFRWLVGWQPIQTLLKERAARTPGPSAAERAEHAVHVWGEAEDARGQKKTARIRVENGYSVTVNSALGVVEALLRREARGPALEPGWTTPALLMGSDYAARLPGSGALVID